MGPIKGSTRRLLASLAAVSNIFHLRPHLFS